MPTFVTAAEGTYTAILSAGGQTVQRRIIAIPPGGRWISVGPTSTAQNIAGHMNAIAIDPVTKDIYAGAEGGGVWKSVDHGASWFALTDLISHTLRVNALVVTRPSTNSGLANIFVGTIQGILQSADAGETWASSGADFSQCDNSRLSGANVKKIAVNPLMPEVIYAATNQGVFRTSDGGACWRWISSTFFNQNVSDVVVAPTSPPTVYAGVWNEGVYSASDQTPTTWTLLSPRVGSVPPPDLSTSLPPSDASFVGWGNVSMGDKRLFVSPRDLALGVPAAGTLVQAGDPDSSRRLTCFQGTIDCTSSSSSAPEYHTDRDGNGVFDPTDVIYRHFSGSVPACPPWGIGVAIGDLRLTGPPFGPLAANSTVRSNDPDLGTCLIAFHPMELHTDTDGDNKFDIGESVYRESAFGEVVLAVADPLTVYVGFEPAPYRVYKGTTAPGTNAISWHELPRAPQNCDNQQCTGWDNFIAVDQRRPNFVYVGQVHLWVTKNDGSSWQDLSFPNRNPAYLGQDMHDDQHALAFDPDAPEILYAGNDGGIYRLTNGPEAIALPESFWTPLNNDLVTTEFYSIASAPSDVADIIGGLQDNGTLRSQSGTIWNEITNDGGDGEGTAFDAGSTTNVPILYYQVSTGDILRWPTPKALGTGQSLFGPSRSFFADPYRRGNLLRIGGQPNSSGLHLYRTLDAAASTTTAAAWDCIDPTSTNSTDAVTAIAFVVPSLQTTAQYFVGMSDGSIYFVQVPNGLPPTPNCGNQLPQGFTSTKFFPSASPSCPSALGNVAALALNPRNVRFLFAAFKDATGVNGPGRVMRIPVDSPQCPQDITGDLEPGLEAKALAADPLAPDFLYLATDKGLFQGTISSPNQSWTWARVAGMPLEVDVTSVELHQSIGGTSGRTRAATFGRGVFELVRGPQTQPIVQQNSISDCALREVSDISASGRVRNVEVAYEYLGDRGTNVRIRATPLWKGKALPFFLSAPQQLYQGSHKTRLRIQYAAQNAPLTTQTDAIRIELFAPKEQPFLSKTCSLAAAWKRHHARVLHVSAVATLEEGAPTLLTLPVEVLANTSHRQDISPFDIVLPEKAKVRLHAPVQRRQGSETLVFAGWSILGQRIKAERNAEIILDTDVTAIARYELRSQPKRTILSLEAVCIDCDSRPVRIPIPIQYVRGESAQREVYAPFAAILPPGSSIAVSAATKVNAGRWSLQLLGWNTPSGEAKTAAVKLRVDKDVVLTANYRYTTGDRSPAK